MAHRIVIELPMSSANKLRQLGRSFHKDESLGINQAAAVLLDALVSGEFVLEPAPAKSKAKAKEAKEPEDTVKE